MPEPQPPDPDDTPPSSADPTLEQAARTDVLADRETDQAVDDIMAQEADVQLAVDDARTQAQAEEAAAAGDHDRGLLAAVFTNPWTWLFIVGAAGVAWAWFH